MESEIRLIAAPHPFKVEIIDVAVPAGQTLEEIMGIVTMDLMLLRHAHVFVGDWLIPRDRWHIVKPKGGSTVTVRVVPTGGGGGSKNPLRTILTIAVIAASFTFGGPLGSALFGTSLIEGGLTLGLTFGQGIALTSAVGGALISVAGNLLINAIAPPPKPKLALLNPDRTKDSSTLFIQGARNRAAPFGVVPSVLGKHRQVPPYGARSFTEIVGKDQFLRMLFVWGFGPLDITNLKIGENALSNFSDVETETVNGFPASDIVELVTNGAFTTDTDWTKGTGWTIAAGVAHSDGSQTADSDLEQSITIVENQSYRVDLTLSNVTAGQITVLVGGKLSRVFIEKGVHSVVIEAGSGGSPEFEIRADASFVGDVDDVSVKLNATFSLFPDSVFEDVLNVALTQAASWQIRTTQLVTDEISVDITFPQGLVGFGTDGSKVTQAVLIEVETSPAGLGTWTSRGSINTVATTSSAVRNGLRFAVPRGQYDVRLRRTTVDHPQSNIFSDSFWTALRTITNEDPIKLPGLTGTALRIKATDQLSGIIDTFNGEMQSIILDWNGAAWVSKKTSNPASLFRHVLQGPANTRPVLDDRVDLTNLQTFHDDNVTFGREFNMVVDFQSSVYETLADIASAGRASPTIRDGRWGVVQDQVQTVPIQHFTPRNSFGFEAIKIFPEIPHGLRVRFVNRDKQWQQDERIVYDDGFNASNATKFEGLELFGITDPAKIWEDGRFHIASARLRPEMYSLNTDMEHIVCTRGDLVRITHDVPLFGLAVGRVKSFTDDGTNILTVTLDEIVTMEAGKSYSCRFRKDDGSSVVTAIVLNIGDSNTLTLVTPILIANGPEIGNIAMFGETGLESVEMIVQSIEPGPDLTARLGLIDASPAIHDAGILGKTFDPADVNISTERIAFASNPFFDDDLVQFTTTGVLPPGLSLITDHFVVGRTSTDVQVSLTEGGSAVDITGQGSGVHTMSRKIPAFDSQITLPAGLGTPAVDDIRSGGEVLFREVDGSLTPRILVTLLYALDKDPNAIEIEARFRVTGTDASYNFVGPVSIEEGEIFIRPVEVGVRYDFFLRYVRGDGSRGDWGALQTHVVVGKTGPPADVTGFTAGARDFDILLTWNAVPDLDNDHYEIRKGTVWSSGTFVNNVEGLTLVVDALSAGTHDYMIKAVDTSDNPSTTEGTAQVVITTPGTPVISSVFNGASFMLSWTVAKGSFAIRHSEVRRGGTSFGDSNPVTVTDTNAYTALVNWIGSETWRVQTTDIAGNVGLDASLEVSATASVVSSLTAQITENTVLLRWTGGPGSIPIESYEIRRGAVFTSAEVIGVSDTNFATIQEIGTGSITYWVQAKDTAGALSVEISVVLIINLAGAPSLSSIFNGNNFELSWSVTAGSFPIRDYEIRRGGTSFGTATAVAFTDASIYIAPVDWAGAEKWWVQATDVLGNTGPATSLDVTVVVPTVANLTAQVIDNTVLLRWSGTPASLPIEDYEVRKGAVFASAEVIGFNDTTFATIFETDSGSFTYWVQPRDTAGNAGTEISRTTTVDQPPDFVFKGSEDTDWVGDISESNIKKLLLGNTAVASIHLTETIDEHFNVNNSFASPQAQIDAGFPHWIEPTLTSASIVEELDMGIVLASSRIVVSLGKTVLDGAPTTQITIGTKKLIGDPYVDFPAGEANVFATDFQFVRTTLDITTSTGDDFIQLDSMSTVVRSKIKNDAGSVTVSANPTTVNFNVSFLDVEGITATAQGTTARTAVVDFNDIPNPVSFDIYLFDSSGVAATGDVRWEARGF